MTILRAFPFTLPFCLAAGMAVAQGPVADPVTVCFEGTSNPELDVFYCSQAIDGGSQDGLSLATLHAIRGRALNGVTRHGQAISDFTAALKLNPNSALTYNNRGLAYHAMGDYRRAANDFGEALALFPRYYDAARNRGTAHFYLSNLARARAEYDKAVDIFPGDPAGQVLRGLAYYFSGQPKVALVALEAASAMQYPYPYLPLWLWLARQHVGIEGTNALKAWTDALQAEAAWPGILGAYYLDRASEEELLLRIRSLPLAVRTIRLSQSHFFIGEKARLLGRIDKARQRFEAALAPDAQRNIEWASAQAGLTLLKR